MVDVAFISHFDVSLHCASHCFEGYETDTKHLSGTIMIDVSDVVTHAVQFKDRFFKHFQKKIQGSF